MTKFENVPMFTVTPLPAPPAARRPKPLRQAICPRGYHGRGTGVILHGEHLYWAEHNTHGFDGKARPCLASNAPLCQYPPRDHAGRIVVPCLCAAGGAA